MILSFIAVLGHPVTRNFNEMEKTDSVYKKYIGTIFDPNIFILTNNKKHDKLDTFLDTSTLCT